jgi:hypothetical protein
MIRYMDSEIEVSQQMINNCGLLKSLYEDCGALFLPATKTVSSEIIRAVDDFAFRDIFPEHIDLRLIANFAVYIDYPDLLRLARRRLEAYLQDKPIEYQYWWQTGTEMVENRDKTYQRNKDIFAKYYAPVNVDNISFHDPTHSILATDGNTKARK